jgi:hypothetical protein
VEVLLVGLELLAKEKMGEQVLLHQPELVAGLEVGVEQMPWE